MKICVTGASGFIASHFLRIVLDTTDHTIVAFARNTCQRNLRRLNQPSIARGMSQGRVRLVYGDLLGDISGLCEGADWVVHFAARTYVDHSIKDAIPFVEANVIGTFKILEDARRHKVKRFVQISTDECYGAILKGAYDESAPINPTNPYCVHPDSMVITPSGRMRIGDLRVGQKIAAHVNGRNQFCQVTGYWLRSSDEKLLKINHSYGSIVVSSRHRCFAVVPPRTDKGKLRDSAWSRTMSAQELKASDVVKGMWLVVARKTPSEPVKASFDQKMARFVGFYVGNGCRQQLPDGRNKYIQICSGYRHLMNYYRDLAVDLFGVSASIYKHKSKECWYLQFGCIGLWQELAQYGDGSANKTCSGMVSQPNDVISSFLAGYFDADGTAGKAVEYSSVSQELISDVRLMLSRLGILSSRGVEYHDGRKPNYKLRITDAKSILKFTDSVPQIKYPITCLKRGQRNLAGEEVVWSPVLSVEEIDNSAGELVDIEVAQAGNFYCDYVLVHNSATKAGADALAISYAHTYGLHTIVTRTENNMGEWQHPQKVFPVFTAKALRGEPLPVYGDGAHVRQWLYVEDHVRGILHLLNADTKPGEVFHIAGNQELTNLELARRILKLLGKPESLIQHIDDRDIRPGHDRRYALDCTKIRNLGWATRYSLDEGIARTVKWNADNLWWSEA